MTIDKMLEQRAKAKLTGDVDKLLEGAEAARTRVLLEDDDLRLVMVGLATLRKKYIESHIDLYITNEKAAFFNTVIDLQQSKTNMIGAARPRSFEEAVGQGLLREQPTKDVSLTVTASAHS